MIARLRILLPYVISVESSATLASHQWTVHGRQVAVVPFYQPRLTADAMGDWGDSVGALFEGLAPSDAPILDLNTTVGGNPAIPATVLQVEEWQATFDRSRAPPAPLPPPASEQIAFLFEIANSVLARFRSIARAAHIHPVSPHTTSWAFEYLLDSGKLPDADETLIRRRATKPFSIYAVGMNATMWEAVGAVGPEYRPRPWEALLYDAEAHLPDVVPALVLAAAALEVLIGHALSVLAPTKEQAKLLWHFINNRGDYRKEPSVVEQFDVLLNALSGRSLKERADLWEAFKNLRAARNSLMHEGKLTIGGQPVSQHTAHLLVTRAKEVGEWLDALLPLEHRRLPSHSDIQLEVVHLLNLGSDLET